MVKILGIIVVIAVFSYVSFVVGKGVSSKLNSNAIHQLYDECLMKEVKQWNV